MKPYYEDAGIAIYHGDCAEVAPLLDAKFDLLCTDPPYGIGEARKCASKRRVGTIVDRRGKSIKVARVNARDYGEASWDDKPIAQSTIDELRARATWQCIFGGNFYSLPPSPSWLIWDKMNTGDFADAELAWTNYGCAARLHRHQWNGMMRGGVAGKQAEPRFHPTQKPLAIMTWAISMCPERPATVFDPFAGSGTTLRACKDLGIRAVGIEAEERYCEIAARRLAQGVLFAGSTGR